MFCLVLEWLEWQPCWAEWAFSVSPTHFRPETSNKSHSFLRCYDPDFKLSQFGPCQSRSSAFWFFCIQQINFEDREYTFWSIYPNNDPAPWDNHDRPDSDSIGLQLKLSYISGLASPPVSKYCILSLNSLGFPSVSETVCSWVCIDLTESFLRQQGPVLRQEADVRFLRAQLIVPDVPVPLKIQTKNNCSDF